MLARIARLDWLRWRSRSASPDWRAGRAVLPRPQLPVSSRSHCLPALWMPRCPWAPPALCPTAAADGARTPQRAVARPQPAHRVQGRAVLVGWSSGCQVCMRMRFVQDRCCTRRLGRGKPCGNGCPPPTFLSSTLQLGALAEFRADWPSALRMYGEAYGYLPQVRTVSVVCCSKLATV